MASSNPQLSEHTGSTGSCPRVLHVYSCFSPELSTMELTAQWSYAFRPPRWQNQRGGGIQDGMQPILQLTRDTSDNWVAVVHLADNQCTHDVREINTRSGSVVEPRSTLWQQLWRGSSWSYQCQCRPWGRRSKKLAARQWCQCGPDQTGSNVVDEKTNTREPQSWRNSAAADWMPSKPKPHRHRRTLSRRGRHSLRVGTGICPLALGQPIKFPTQNNFSWMPTNNNMVCPVHLPNVTVASQGISGVTWP